MFLHGLHDPFAVVDQFGYNWKEKARFGGAEIFENINTRNAYKDKLERILEHNHSVFNVLVEDKWMFLDDTAHQVRK